MDCVGLLTSTQVSMSSLSCMPANLFFFFFLSLFFCEIRCHISFWKAAPQNLQHWPSKIHCGCWLTSASDLSNHRSKPSAFQLVGLIRGPPWRANQVTSYWTQRNYVAFNKHLRAFPSVMHLSTCLRFMFFLPEHVNESVLGDQVLCFQLHQS